MKKKKTSGKRLELNRETIRALSEPSLSEVHGGLWTCHCSEGSCGSGCCAPYSDVCSGPICVNAQLVPGVGGGGGGGFGRGGGGGGGGGGGIQ